SCKRQQRDVARLLDRQGKPPLVRRANARQTPGNDLSTLRDKLREQTNVLVVDVLDLLDAELADFLTPEILAPALAATRTTRTAARPRTARSRTMTLTALTLAL